MIPRLVRGMGSLKEKTACWLSAASYIAGYEWTDEPECTCPSIIRFGMLANDLISTDHLRAKHVGPRIEQVLGTRSDEQLPVRRDMCVRFAKRCAIDAVKFAGFESIADILSGESSSAEFRSAGQSVKANSAVEGIVSAYSAYLDYSVASAVDCAYSVASAVDCAVDANAVVYAANAAGCAANAANAAASGGRDKFVIDIMLPFIDELCAVGTPQEIPRVRELSELSR